MKHLMDVARLSLISLALSASLSAYAAETGTEIKNLVPASALPGVASPIQSEETPATLLAPATKIKDKQPESQGTLGPQAEKVKFKLKTVILEDNKVYSDAALLPVFKSKLNTSITVAQLQGIVQDITNFYRNNGYILSRAILPPQRVKNGLVHIRIIEGFIDQVKVIGAPRGSRQLLQAYGDRIAKSRPLQIKVIEYYLRLANEIPGVAVKAVLEPSKKLVGGSDLALSSKQELLTGSLSYDNYGTHYVGPNQLTAVVTANSLFRSGDSTRLIYATTARPKEMKFYDISEQTPIGTNGLNATFGKSISHTRPGLNLRPLKINGSSNTYYGSLAYPLIRARDQSLTIDGGFSYIDSQVLAITSPPPLYTDHLRVLKAGFNYNFSDRYYGSNLVGVHAEHGLKILGATHQDDSVTTSRFGGRGQFTKIVMQLGRVQFIKGRYSAFIGVNGQYAFNPLLSAQQFSFGGSQLGRGYDSAEIIGDRGLASTVELRMDMAPSWAYVLQSLQPYVFYDTGVVWNLKDVNGIKRKQSAASTGFGSRFGFNKFFSGNVMFAQPLTKGVAAEAPFKRARAPRVFFSLTANI